jgi:hypothetical protein
LESLEDRWLPSTPAVITWANPADITYGTLLSATQLNATANVPGTFVYNPPVGARLQAGHAELLGVTFQPDDTIDYSYASTSVTINVNPKPLTVAGIMAENKVYDGTTAATFSTASASLVGVLGGDQVSLDTAPHFIFASNVFQPVQSSFVELRMAVDAGGAAYVANVADAYDDTVTVLDPRTGDRTLAGVPIPFVSSQYSMVADALGNLYVGNGTTVVKFAPGDMTPSATLTGLNGPSALAVDASNNLYVANSGNDTISKFTPGTTAPSAVLTGLNSPNALAFDMRGNLYVSNNGNDTVSKFAPGTTTPGATLTGVQNPIAVAVDPDGNVYVATSAIPGQSDGTVSKFLPGSTTPSATLTNAQNPIALATDASGNLYVAQYGAVSKFAKGSLTPTAFLVTRIDTGYSSALGFDAGGNLYVASNSNNVINPFTGTNFGYVSSYTSDALSAHATAAFASKDVGNNIPVTVSNLTLEGPQAYDYVLVSPTTQANITPALLTITASPNTKTFDGKASAAALPTVSGLVGTDTVTGLSEAYNNPAPGTGKTLLVTGYTVNDGNNGNNYVVTTVPDRTGVITPSLTVTSFTPTATGFTATFSKPFVAADLTEYGSDLSTVQDVTLVGAHSGPIAGTVYVDPSNQSITFTATESALETFFSTPVLPDDSYTVTLVSGTANGFGDGSAGLDGASNGGRANYTTTFTTANQSKTILSLPDFARGPDAAHNIQIPNDTGHGIPVTLYNAVNVTDVSFVLSFNPALLTMAGGLGGTGSDATDPASSFRMLLVPAPPGGAHFVFHDNTPLSGTVILGDILASVPVSAGSAYKAKDLLQFRASTSTEGRLPARWAPVPSTLTPTSAT